MAKVLMAHLAIGAAAAAVVVAQAPAQTAQAVPPARPAAGPSSGRYPAVDLNILHVQVILDHLGFSPGILDGKRGQSLTLALRGFQEARGLRVTGEMDTPTLQALRPHAGWRPTRRLRITPGAVAGPFFTIPKDEGEQARLPALGYSNPLEKLAESFHTTPAVLIALNSPETRLSPGAVVTFPNALPTSRAYDPKLRADWRQTLNMLNVDATQQQGDRIVVDKSDGSMRVLGKDGKILAQFPVTTGSEYDPLPIGRWRVTVIDYNPKFRYNPDLFWDAKRDDDPALLPAGPNGPVGVVWLDLNKPHYGLHGSPEPQLIGRTESHGCVRLANWNAARLAQMVKPGVTVIFQA